MFFRQALAGLMQLFAVFAFFTIGFFCVCLPFSFPLRFRLAQSLLEETAPLVWIGIGFFSLTLLLIVGFYCVSKERLLSLTMGKPLAEVDIRVLRKTIEPLLAKQFASQVRLAEIEICRKNHLRMGLMLAPMDEKELKKTLFDVESHLQAILAERFGYRGPFTVQIILPSA